MEKFNLIEPGNEGNVDHADDPFRTRAGPRPRLLLVGLAGALALFALVFLTSTLLINPLLYDPTMNATDIAMGRLEHSGQEAGMFVLLLGAPLACLMLGWILTLVPVFIHSSPVKRLLFGTLFTAFLAANLCALFLLIRPQHVFFDGPDSSVRNNTTRHTTGAADSGTASDNPDLTTAITTDAALKLNGASYPVLVLIGCAIFIPTLYFTALCALAALPAARRRLTRALARPWAAPLVLTALFVLLGLTLSNFMASPLGDGAKFPAVYFPLSSPYSIVNYPITSHWVFKLYPDVVAYYLFVAGVMCIAAAARRFPAVRSFLHRRAWAPTGLSPQLAAMHPFPVGFSYGELILFVALALFIGWWAFYWESYPHLQDKIRAHSTVDVDAEIQGNTLGFLVSLLSALVLLPASRTGVWCHIFGVSYERTLKYHRLLGVLCLFVLTCHAAIWWIKWAVEGTFFVNIIAYRVAYMSPTHITQHEFTIPLVEVAWGLLLASILVTALLRHRAAMYVVFQHFHAYAGLVYYGVAMMHAWSFWYYAAGSVALWLCDKLARGSAAMDTYAIDDLRYHPTSGIVSLRVQAPAARPGQYFFVNVPDIGMAEWHPFSAGRDSHGSVVFYVKHRHPVSPHHRTTWTDRLATLAATSPCSIPIARLHGPFGYIETQPYRSIVLIAGGIGLTPLLALITSLHDASLRPARQPTPLQSVILVWMFRNAGEYHLFHDQLAAVAGPLHPPDTRPLLQETSFGCSPSPIRNRSVEFTVKLHCTDPASLVQIQAETQAETKLTSSTVLASGPANVSSLLLPSASAGQPHDGLPGDLSTPLSASDANEDSLFDSVCTPPSPSRIPVAAGRCPLQDIFAQHADGAATLVAVCGPPALVRDASALAWQAGCAFFTETFSF
eukprot:m.6484 g.6484  ORF g.6484 m.6484 type:complete len:897 (-) comp2102_c0_seq1:134-2824(-)